jgi:hypothetical protein
MIGGVRNSRELLEAARREPVVAAHYAEFSVANARAIRLPHDKFAYVSYRLGNHIYWTKGQVTWHQGEILLSDGQHLARTRCGNRISDMTPVSPQQPAEKLLSTPFLPAHLDIDPAFLAATPIWHEHATALILMAMHDMPPTSNLGPSLGFPPLVAVFCCGGKSPASPPSAPSYPLPQPGYPPPLSVTTPEPATFLLLLSSLVLLPLLMHLRPYSLGRQALTPLAIFGRARLLQPAEES